MHLRLVPLKNGNDGDTFYQKRKKEKTKWEKSNQQLKLIQK